MFYEEKTPKWISPTICVTHACQLNCIYCYENNKDCANSQSFEKAIEIIENVFSTVSPEVTGIEFCFIGGEPLLEFGLIKKIVEYYKPRKKEYKQDFIFSATTNGALLNSEMKNWFKENTDIIILCLSLDGTKDTHDRNRDNSFDKIDFEFFINNYPKQGVKMTLSEYSLPRLYDNITFIHSLGFKRINGVNLFEGNFDFSDPKYIKMLIPQLKKLVDFYSRDENAELYNQLFDKRLELTQSKLRRKKKNCGIGGAGVRFYDVDGKAYPCVMCTPMTLNDEKLEALDEFNFEDDTLFIDERCNESCLIYPICSNCAGSNYKCSGSFSVRDYSKCMIKKLEVLFCADLMARKILINRNICENDTVLFHTIQAIKAIKQLYYPVFSPYMDDM